MYITILYYKFNKKWKILFGTEYLTTCISNTLKKEFYRGNPNQTNYYSYIDYDYFSGVFVCSCHTKFIITKLTLPRLMNYKKTND